MIQARITWPCKGPNLRDCEARNAELTLEFGILKDGELQFVEVRKSSGARSFDDNSKNAILLAAPFPPPPATMLTAMRPGSTGIAILGQFIYTYELSLRTFVR